jgi:hypothetical protein
MNTPSSKYFKASAELDALQEQLNKTRKCLQDGIGEVRLNCVHAFEVCWKDPKDPEAWSVYPPVSPAGFPKVDLTQAHSCCIYCGVEGGNANVGSSLRRRAKQEAEDMRMTDEELYGVSSEDLNKPKDEKPS